MSDTSAMSLERAKAFFERAVDAAKSDNYDYAFKMFQDALKLAPGNLAYRQALRAAQRKRFGNDPSKVGRMAGVRVQPIRLRIKTAKAKHNWPHVLDLCEEAFEINPWDLDASKDAAEAADHLKYPALAEWLIDSVIHQAGEDAHFLRFAARAYEGNQNWHRAIACWEKVKKLDPSDESASRQINSLSANAAIAKSGLHEAIQKADAGSVRDARSGPESFQPDPEEMKLLAMAPEERWLKAIDAEPLRVGPYLELADHYRMRNKLDEAEKVLARALKALPQDNVIKMAHAEVQISRLHKAIDDWTKAVKQRPDDEAAKAKLDKLIGMLNDYEIKEFRRRLELRPDDLNLRLQLGLRLAKADRHDEAIAEFQQARGSLDDKVKVDSMLHAGESFEASGVLKLAERSYLDALKCAVDQPTLNAINYRLGRVSEAQGKMREAEEYYNEVAANDFSYQDVAKRLRSLNQKRGS